jgi:hypothetical protein
MLSEIGEAEIYMPLFDYFDSPGATQQGKNEKRLAQSAEVLAQDLVNAAVYSHQILGWRDRAREYDDLGTAVVIVCTLTEGFLVSLRCACDALAMGLSVAACAKAGQAPQDSLRALLNWAKQNQSRVHPKLLPILVSEADWFWKLRTIRDYLVHQGSHTHILWNGEEFRLSLFPRFEGGAFQQPLRPLMASISEQLVAFAYNASEAVQGILPLPPDRKRSRVLHSPFIPYLKALCQFSLDRPDTAH